MQSIQFFGKKIPLPLLFFYFAAMLVTWLVRDHFFFWDTVQLASRHAHHFYENGFGSLLLPDEMDSGHPPLFGFGLAFLWKIFYKNLLISHLYILFFLLILICQAYKLGDFLFGYWGGAWFCTFLCASPVVAGQAVLVSPDVVLCLFFAMSLRGIFENNHTILGIGALGLSMTSLRGMMTLVVLFAQFLFVNRVFIKQNFKNIPFLFKKFVVPFLPSAIFGLGFLIWHWTAKGWIGYFGGSSWADSFAKSDGKGLLKNAFVVGWRLIDFGHLFLWIAIFYAIFRKKFDKKIFDFVSLLVFSLLFLTPSALLYVGLNGHRYFLPIYISLILLALSILKSQKTKWILIFGLLTGNFWVYPQPIATGWDATLAHLPFYELRKEMMNYIDKNNLNMSDIGTVFPQLDAQENLSLNGDIRTFAAKDFKKNKYIFYSNIMNDFTAEELQTLQKDWKKRFILGGGQVEVILYEK
ncbi:MAG: hypothetical protein RL757_1531 [Bacteroidota bacterium]|jgi:hypothetical protein